MDIPFGLDDVQWLPTFLPKQDPNEESCESPLSGLSAGNEFGLTEGFDPTSGSSVRDPISEIFGTSVVSALCPRISRSFSQRVPAGSPEVKQNHQTISCLYPTGAV
jgi:hypothetical protein